MLPLEGCLVLADYHHGDLFESLRLLFCERLGAELYRPIGISWFEEGYWSVWRELATANQYLGLNIAVPPKDVHGLPVTQSHGDSAWLNRYVEGVDDGIYAILDPNHKGKLHRAVTLERAKEMNFDIVLTSLDQHFHLFEDFISKYCPKAKHIAQIGNINQDAPAGAENVMCSTTLRQPEGLATNWVHYHQEFDLNEFCYVECARPKSMCNIMHYQQGHWDQLFMNVQKRLVQAGFNVRNYGAGNPDGPVMDVAQTMKEFGWIWHCKRNGDGYGHNVHNAFACGRPMVVSMHEYRNQMGGLLFTNGKTVIDIRREDGEEISRQIIDATEHYDEWSQRVYDRFNEVVCFNLEAEKIKTFLSMLR